MKKQKSLNSRRRTDETIADRIFDQVVVEIFSGSLRPNDSLSERDVVMRYGGSRTPVREVLKRLGERGFLTVGRRNTSVVRDMSREEVEELYQLRIRLERVAAIVVAAHITESEIARLKQVAEQFAQAVNARDLIGMLNMRANFHAVLARATGNRWLADILIMLREYAYPVRHAHWQNASRAAHTVTLHAGMIQCLESRDGAGFRRLAISQITEALEAYRDRLIPSRVAVAPVVRSAAHRLDQSLRSAQALRPLRRRLGRGPA